MLVARGAKLVGIDSYNIDDTSARTRPVHTLLLGAGVLICEHMTNLAALPAATFTFSAVPPKIAGMGTFPVRAFAALAASAVAQPAREDRAAEIVDAAMLHREAELGIGDSGSRPGGAGGTTRGGG